MPTITIQYYALLREQRGLSEESLQTDARSAEALYAALQESHGFTLGIQHVRAAINGKMQPWDTPISDGDTVTLIPPVAGG
jgi:sulfur-carrier protein